MPDTLTVTAVAIPPVGLPGELRRVPRPAGIVIFAHGSGSSRLSPRNRQVAEALAEVGLDTLLFDLLTGDEAADRANVFDIDLLAGRLVDAIDWVRAQPALAALPVGLFGASTGAAAAGHDGGDRFRPDGGGRPDLAADALDRVSAPTLLIVGSDDEPVLGWNREAGRRLGGPASLVVVPGATHLFEEPGAMDQVIRIAGDWFADHLGHLHRASR